MKLTGFSAPILVLILLFNVSSVASAQTLHEQKGMLDRMKIVVPASANRPVSFTNKEAAYYYTQTHDNNHPEWSWFAGMNIAKNWIFSAHHVYVGDFKLE